MDKLSYKGLKISNTNPNKWYIYYVLILPNGESVQRKEEGKRYQISLNSREMKDNPKIRKDNADDLLQLVRKDLEKGIDPIYRNEIIDERNKLKLLEAQKTQDAKINIDDAIDILKREKGWINPTSLKRHASNVIPTFLKNSFKNYLIKIGKDDDLRKVNRMDIVNYIEENFNRTGDFDLSGRGRKKKTGWSSSSCTINKTRISLLFSTLMNKGMVENNPTLGVKIKSDSEKIDKTEENDIDKYEAWTVEESTEFFKSLAKPKNIKEHIFLAAGACLFYGFVRKSEILRLKPSMFNMSSDTLIIPAKQTKAARKYKVNELIPIDITPKFKAILEPYLKAVYPNGFETDDYLFFQDDSKQEYNYGTFNRHWDEVRKSLIEIYKDRGLFVGRAHYALKHTGTIAYYNALVKAGKSPIELQRLLQKHCRHSDWSQTESYLRDKCKVMLKENKEIIDF